VSREDTGLLYRVVRTGTRKDKVRRERKTENEALGSRETKKQITSGSATQRHKTKSSSRFTDPLTINTRSACNKRGGAKCRGVDESGEFQIRNHRMNVSISAHAADV